MTKKPLFDASVFRFYCVRPLPDGIEGDGVRQLWMAVLQRALQDYFQLQQQVLQDAAAETAAKTRKQLAKLDEWLHDPRDTDITSFAGICTALDLEASILLSNIENLTVADLQKLRRSGGNKCTPTELVEFSLL